MPGPVNVTLAPLTLALSAPQVEDVQVVAVGDAARRDAEAARRAQAIGRLVLDAELPAGA